MSLRTDATGQFRWLEPTNKDDLLLEVERDTTFIWTLDGIPDAVFVIPHELEPMEPLNPLSYTGSYRVPEGLFVYRRGLSRKTRLAVSYDYERGKSHEWSYCLTALVCGIAVSTRTQLPKRRPAIKPRILAAAIGGPVLQSGSPPVLPAIKNRD